MDYGFNFQRSQGVKREGKGLPVNIFGLGLDGGLISHEPEGSLTKWLG
jgi:hypothetical protein